VSELFELGMSGRWKRPKEDEQGAGSCGAEKLEKVDKNKQSMTRILTNEAG